MRLAIGILASAFLGPLSHAQANPPAAPPATEPAAAPTATAPTTLAPGQQAQSAAPTQGASKQTVIVEGTPEYDSLEKHFLAEGYKIEMHGGEKLFCRREEELGSRLGGRKVCSGAQQLMVTERDAQRSVTSSMMRQNNPSGH